MFVYHGSLQAHIVSPEATKPPHQCLLHKQGVRRRTYSVLNGLHDSVTRQTDLQIDVYRSLSL